MDDWKRDIGNTETDKHVHRLLSKLLFISKLRPNEKIDSSSVSFVENTWSTSLSRTWKTYIAGTEESRYSTLKFIQDTTNEAIKTINTYIVSTNSREKQIGILIFTRLKDATKSLYTLSETYQDDRSFVSQIESLIELLHNKMAEIVEIVDPCQSIPKQRLL